MSEKKRNKRFKITAIVLLAFALLIAGGYTVLYYNGLSGRYVNTEYKQGQIKVACVGDSITYGHGVSNWPKNNYPAVLGRLLGDDYCVLNFGVSGSAVQSTSDKPYKNTKRFEQMSDFDADVIVLMIGSNDSKPENWKGVDAFKREYNSLIDTLLSEDNTKKIYLCTSAMPYYTQGEEKGLMKFDISKEQVDQITDIVKEISTERNLELIDINALTAEHPGWFEKDGIHPDKDGAESIAKAVFKQIEFNK